MNTMSPDKIDNIKEQRERKLIGDIVQEKLNSKKST